MTEHSAAERSDGLVHYLARFPGCKPWEDELGPESGFRWRIGKRRALVLFLDRFQWHSWFIPRSRGRRHHGIRYANRARLVRSWPV
jgi:hypothetical protein